MGFTKTGDFYYGLHAGIRDIYVGAIDPASGKVLEEPRIASQRFLGSNRAPSWSPDGENLAYFMAPGGSGRQPTSLIIRALKSGQERTLRRDLRPNLNIPPRWSPDGQWLLVNSRDERGRVGLHRINVETGAIVPVHENAFWGVWTPDAKSIILAPRGDERSIRIRDLDTGQEKELFRLVEPMYVSNLALSPDGRRLAFGMPGDIIGQIITILPLDGGTPKELMRVDILGGGQFAGLNWAPDGKHLYFSRSGQMWRIAADGGEPQPISLNANGSDGLSVHPDGRRIAFVSGEQKEEVWVMENLLPVPGK
jgi:Tol biopolymer transport system component